ncbi:hypothetical protein APS56_11395 [Pseudalgibacter alginicilyticus]|uniref:Uncharacterized protein n=1 Tax=Pseudalgibacter alginicilyticus TaxID=1736674 RepID=A0A0P0D9Y5_9FLAO|nr:hypothetical protein APS56_11395 [Pseudalgibacter alginicilyticus]
MQPSQTTSFRVLLAGFITVLASFILCYYIKEYAISETLTTIEIDVSLKWKVYPNPTFGI